MWFCELPESIKTKAIQNTKKRFLERSYSSLEMAIFNSFVWSETEQGFNYWKKLYNKYGGKTL